MTAWNENILPCLVPPYRDCPGKGVCLRYRVDGTGWQCCITDPSFLSSSSSWPVKSLHYESLPCWDKLTLTGISSYSGMVPTVLPTSRRDFFPQEFVHCFYSLLWILTNQRHQLSFSICLLGRNSIPSIITRTLQPEETDSSPPMCGWFLSTILPPPLPAFSCAGVKEYVLLPLRLAGVLLDIAPRGSFKPN